MKPTGTVGAMPPHCKVLGCCPFCGEAVYADFEASLVGHFSGCLRFRNEIPLAHRSFGDVVHAVLERQVYA